MNRFSLKALLLTVTASVFATVVVVHIASLMQPTPSIRIQAGVDTDDAARMIEIAKSAIQQRESWNVDDSVILVARIDGNWQLNVSPRPLTPGLGLALTIDDNGKLIEYLQAP
ncbi:hypothetical protein MFFC18_25950 [Mariniblastus fucicola]|uniref:PepSY domain-containing protein n=1 Tax=Mariniblastus fucicola TaxID=980251 RepID=A0A5B9PCS6_9BACT|nr:hypothetical protein MFFC18_25950 [Mariniblastus fucicola]